MYRDISEKLIQWKNQTNKKPLILSGARQVGKKYSLLAFAKMEYPSYIYINFERNLDIKKQFEQTADPVEIIMYLKLRFNQATFKKEELLIILDEIQACPQP